MRQRKVVYVVIPREQWGRGCLRAGLTGRSCVLGHIALTCGIAPQDINDRDNYNHLNKKQRDKLPSLLRLNTRVSCEFTTELMAVNDDVFLSRTTKEDQLIEMLKRAAVHLEFEDTVHQSEITLAKLRRRS